MITTALPAAFRSPKICRISRWAALSMFPVGCRRGSGGSVTIARDRDSLPLAARRAAAARAGAIGEADGGERRERPLPSLHPPRRA
jgi:hypothetical protein